MEIKRLKDFVVETIKEYKGRIGVEVAAEGGYTEFKKLDLEGIEAIFKESNELSIYENQADRILSTLVAEGDDYTQYNFAIIDLAMGKFKSAIGDYFEAYEALTEDMEFKKNFSKENFKGDNDYLNSYLDFGLENDDYWLMATEIECDAIKDLEKDLDEIKKLILENN